MLSPILAAGKPDYANAVKLLSERKFEAALKELKAVVAVNPEHAEAHFQIGRILIAANRAYRAIASLSTAAAIKPQARNNWQAWAESVALGGSDEDEKSFLTALRSAPVDPKLRVELQDRFGSLRSASRPTMGGMNAKAVRQLLNLVNKRDFANAADKASKALSAFPNSALAANILAVAQANLGKDVEAKSNYLKAINLDPRYAEAYDNYGRFLLSKELPEEAANYLRKAVILAPRMVTALVSLGSALNQTKEHRAAVILLERAVSEAPSNMRAHLELANSYAGTNRSENAEEEYETARTLANDDITPAHRSVLAQLQAKNGKEDIAMENFERTLDVFPDFPQALSGKASLLQSFGKFDEARDLFRLASSVDPENGENYRLLLASHKVERGDPIIEEMLDVYGKKNLSEFSRMNLAFAIAKALEDSKDFSSVFNYLNDANALVRKSAPYLIQKRFNQIKWLKEAYDDFDYVAALAENGCDAAPIFVTGMPRSGTTLVEQIIASHSTMTGAGELGFASRQAQKLVLGEKAARPIADIPRSHIAQVGLDYAEYISERIPGAERITDKAINTYLHIGLLKLAMPNACFIVVRRDPRDNLLSVYKNKFPEGTHPYAYDMEDLAHYYGTFVEMVDFWRERVPDWFYEVNYDDLVSDPEEESRKLIDACGLEWEDACLNFHENKNRVQTLSVYQVRQPISKASLKGWKRYEKDLEPMIEILRKDGHVTD